jgi:hypothetical protein
MAPITTMCRRSKRNNELLLLLLLCRSCWLLTEKGAAAARAPPCLGVLSACCCSLLAFSRRLSLLFRIHCILYLISYSAGLLSWRHFFNNKVVSSSREPACGGFVASYCSHCF